MNGSAADGVRRTVAQDIEIDEPGEHDWGERLQAHLNELEQLREQMQARLDQLEQRIATLEAQTEIVVEQMIQVADMLDDWQAVRDRIVAEDEARLREGVRGDDK